MLKIKNKDVFDIISIFEQFNFKCYVVGGAIRDSLLCNPISDYDFATNAKIKDVFQIFNSLGCKVIPTGEKFGVVTIIYNNSSYEVATFRTEGKYNNKREPQDIRFISDIKDDLARRDFTINAMAYNKDGIVDPFNGQVDLYNKLIRSVGNPDIRFKEDPLRMIRAIRFASVYNFKIEKSTFKSIKRNMYLVKNVSMERINMELKKILTSNNPGYGLERLSTSDFFKILFPYIDEMYGVNQLTKYHDKNLWEHTISVVELTPNDYRLRMAALLHDIGKTHVIQINQDGSHSYYNHEYSSVNLATEILDKLKVNSADKNVILKLIKYHMIDISNVSDKTLKKYINKIGEKDIYLLFELLIADKLSSAPNHRDIKPIINARSRVAKIINDGENLKVKDLQINGGDLISIGYQEGPEIGKQLNHLLDICLDNPDCNNKEFLINESIKQLSI